MKLLLINWQDRCNPHAGGAEMHLHHIFGRLVARGHSVTLLGSGWNGAEPRACVDGIHVHRVGDRYTYGLRVHRYFRRYLAGQKWDVVVEALNKVPVFTPRWAEAPTVLLVHHLFGKTAFREASPPVAAATWLLERPLARVYRGTPVQAISSSTAEDLVARGLRRSDITVIRPGVDLDFFTPDPDVPRMRYPTLVYVGRLKRYKRVDIAIRATAILRHRGRPVRLLIAGRGDQELRLRRLAGALEVGDAVEFRGFVSETEKRDLFRRAWFNLYPSPKEGWGIANVEAAACGTPSVVSNSPGLRESVRDGVTGVLVSHGNAPALADALSALFDAPEQRKSMGANARRFAETLGWEAATDRTEQHLLSIVQSVAPGKVPSSGHILSGVGGAR